MRNNKFIVKNKIYSHGEHIGFIKPIRSKWWKKPVCLMVLDPGGSALGTITNTQDAFRMAIGFHYNRSHTTRPFRKLQNT